MTRCSDVSSACSVSYSRCAAAFRTRETSRASVVAPGSSTRRSRSQPTAPSNFAFGPSPVVHARASIHSASSCSAPAKSLSPYSR